MDRAARVEKIADLKRIVAAVKAALDDHADAMWDIQEEFQAERRAILAAVKRQRHGRAQTSNLLLCVRSRPDRALRTPTADWKSIEGRGHRVMRAKATMAGKQRWRVRPTNGFSSNVNIFSNTIPKNRKFGWRTKDLLRYAHACEIDLVIATEAKLQPLRKQVDALTVTGTRALQSLYQHERALQAGSDKEGSPRAVSPKPMAKGTLQNQTLAPRPDPPQFRHPYTYPIPMWPAPRVFAEDPDDAALDPGAPPQFRRPI